MASYNAPTFFCIISKNKALEFPYSVKVTYFLRSLKENNSV